MHRFLTQPACYWSTSDQNATSAAVVYEQVWGAPCPTVPKFQRWKWWPDNDMNDQEAWSTQSQQQLIPNDCVDLRHAPQGQKKSEALVHGAKWAKALGFAWQRCLGRHLANFHTWGQDAIVKSGDKDPPWSERKYCILSTSGAYTLGPKILSNGVASVSFVEHDHVVWSATKDYVAKLPTRPSSDHTE